MNRPVFERLSLAFTSPELTRTFGVQIRCETDFANRLSFEETPRQDMIAMQGRHQIGEGRKRSRVATHHTKLKMLRGFLTRPLHHVYPNDAQPMIKRSITDTLRFASLHVHLFSCSFSVVEFARQGADYRRRVVTGDEGSGSVPD